MKLTMKTKPKRLTLSQIWSLYLVDEGEETSGFVIKMLDLCYPKLNREKMDAMDKMGKYWEAKSSYFPFLDVIKGMVGNG